MVPFKAKGIGHGHGHSHGDTANRHPARRADSDSDASAMRCDAMRFEGEVTRGHASVSSLAARL